MSLIVGRTANNAVRFALELAALCALGLWGWRTGTDPLGRLALAVSAPLLAATAWGQFVAPRAPHHLPRPGRRAVEAAVFGAAALALVGLGHPRLAGSFALLSLINTVLVHWWEQDVRARVRASKPFAGSAV